MTQLTIKQQDNLRCKVRQHLANAQNEYHEAILDVEKLKAHHEATGNMSMVAQLENDLETLQAMQCLTVAFGLGHKNVRIPA